MPSKCHLCCSLKIVYLLHCVSYVYIICISIFSDRSFSLRTINLGFRSSGFDREVHFKGHMLYTKGQRFLQWGRTVSHFRKWTGEEDKTIALYCRTRERMFCSSIFLERRKFWKPVTINHRVRNHWPQGRKSGFQPRCRSGWKEQRKRRKCRHPTLNTKETVLIAATRRQKSMNKHWQEKKKRNPKFENKISW